MTAIAILPLKIDGNGVMYHAVAGDKESFGKTAGQALDALTLQLDLQEANTLIIVQNLRADRFFTAEQQTRLSILMERWRTARDSGKTLPSAEQTELNKLVAQELHAAELRAAAILHDISQ